MNKTKRHIIISIITLVFLLVFFLTFKLYNHELNQNKRISDLESTVSMQLEKITELQAVTDLQAERFIEANKSIDSLTTSVRVIQAENNSLTTRLCEAENAIKFLTYRIKAIEPNAIHYSDEEFNYLAIGNSITRHEACSYWWHSSNGMSASDLEHDYVHLVLKYLEEKHNMVHLETLVFGSGVTSHRVSGDSNQI